jgi:hypothetical protein
VLAFISDYGVESKLVEMPCVDITKQWIRDAVARENRHLLKYITDSDVAPDIQLLTRSSPDFLGHDAKISDTACAADVAAGAEWVNSYFPNAVYVPGLKHGMANLSEDQRDG